MTYSEDLHPINIIWLALSNLMYCEVYNIIGLYLYNVTHWNIALWKLLWVKVLFSQARTENVFIGLLRNVLFSKQEKLYQVCINIVMYSRCAQHIW